MRPTKKIRAMPERAYVASQHPDRRTARIKLHSDVVEYADPGLIAECSVGSISTSANLDVGWAQMGVRRHVWWGTRRENGDGEKCYVRGKAQHAPH